LMVKRSQYMEASDRFKRVLGLTPLKRPDVFTQLYKRLNIQFENMNLRILIADLHIASADYQSAFFELEDAIEMDPLFTQSYFLLSKIYRHCEEKKEIEALFEGA